LLNRCFEILDICKGDAPFDEWAPEENCEGTCWMFKELLGTCRPYTPAQYLFLKNRDNANHISIDERNE
jgi:hypothetical protein